MNEKESIYQVLRGLSEFVRDHSIALGEEQSPGEKKELPVQSQEEKPANEQQAFMEAMKGVKKMDRKKNRIRESGREAKSVAFKECERTMEETLDQSYAFNVVNLPEYMEGYVDDMNPLVMEKLRTGEFSVQKVLDLHGLSAREARDIFNSFIGEAIHSQVKCVKVIHGRGLKSKKGPVLKQKLKEWIVRAMHRKWVVAFCSAKMTEGGPGATTILFRTSARKKHLHIIG